MSFNKQSVTNDFVKEVQTELQESLVQGWKNFLGSKDLKVYQDFFLFLSQAGFDESYYRTLIPNPAYDNAAKLMGKPFLETARKLGIHFDENFPGEFTTSKEKLKNDCEVRCFYLKAYYHSRFLCLFVLAFSHQHDRLYFPYPPELIADISI
ncbi:MAG: hypothetical protein BRC41_05670 [Cyanobacteria bacterium QH_9_48_43]|nr:MAG: hypothetical protein BRC41_05670 [Cyanobacteria bacterium QH_9_48_43]